MPHHPPKKRPGPGFSSKTRKRAKNLGLRSHRIDEAKQGKGISPGFAARLALLEEIRSALASHLAGGDPANVENYRTTQLLVKVLNAETETEKQALRHALPERDLTPLFRIWRAFEKLPEFRKLTTKKNLAALIAELKDGNHAP